LEATVFAAKLGVLIGPLRNSEGWQIIRVENKQAERQLRFAEMREKIRTALYQQREKQRRIEFINDLKSVAKIEYVK
jgi:parvulin-like peptidyl-prolyl isomerase